MKLLKLTARANLWYSLITLLLSAVVLFFVLKAVMLEEIEEQLEMKVHRIEKALAAGSPVLESHTTLSETAQPGKPVFSDTLIFEEVEEEYENFRKLTTFVQTGGKVYQIETAVSRLEWDDFFEVIFAVFIGSALLLLLSGLWINYRVSQKIWGPFFQNLQKLQSFSLKSEEGLILENSTVDEFTELNLVLQKMLAQGQADYQSLKDFTGNASHEIQTPLSVILSGLDELGQHTEMGQQAAERIQKIKTAATRLSRLNRNLLVLAKIENRQFSQVEILKLKDVVNSHVQMMADIFATKEIHPKVEIDEAHSVRANPALLDILIGNLLGNAFRYSQKAAEVKIQTEGNQLVFSNPGPPLSVRPSRLFERFYKGSQAENSHGLGLAIAKQICEVHGWEISYSYRAGRHCFGVGV